MNSLPIILACIGGLTVGGIAALILGIALCKAAAIPMPKPDDDK